MSRENLEIVRSVFEASGRRDGAAVFALYDPDVEWDASRSPLPRLVGGSVLRGHDGLRAFFRERADGFEHAGDACEELIDAGEAVVSVVRVRGRGRTSGIEVEQRMAAVWTVRDGKVVRVVWFSTRDEALEAVGFQAS
jgi:ketosteroid isomerase-like protein